jgi:hypothetical protein
MANLNLPDFENFMCIAESRAAAHEDGLLNASQVARTQNSGQGRRRGEMANRTANWSSGGQGNCSGSVPQSYLQGLDQLP